MTRAVLAVFVGGLVGCAIRFGLDTAIPHGDADLPVDTLIINVTGSLVLGFLVAAVWPAAPTWMRAGVGTGVLGGYTTFSAFAVSLVSLALADEWLLAAAYLLATVLIGFVAAALGIWIGERLRHRRADAAERLEVEE